MATHAVLGTLLALQRPLVPLYTPTLTLAGMPAGAMDRGALYAGEAHRLHDVVGAAEAVARLTP